MKVLKYHRWVENIYPKYDGYVDVWTLPLVFRPSCSPEDKNITPGANSASASVARESN